MRSRTASGRSHSGFSNQSSSAVVSESKPLMPHPATPQTGYSASAERNPWLSSVGPSGPSWREVEHIYIDCAGFYSTLQYNRSIPSLGESNGHRQNHHTDLSYRTGLEGGVAHGRRP